MGRAGLVAALLAVTLAGCAADECFEQGRARGARDARAAAESYRPCLLEDPALPEARRRGRAAPPGGDARPRRAGQGPVERGGRRDARGAAAVLVGPRLDPAAAATREPLPARRGEVHSLPGAPPRADRVGDARLDVHEHIPPQAVQVVVVSCREGDELGHVTVAD